MFEYMNLVFTNDWKELNFKETLFRKFSSTDKPLSTTGVIYFSELLIDETDYGAIFNLVKF